MSDYKNKIIDKDKYEFNSVPEEKKKDDVNRGHTRQEMPSDKKLTEMMNKRFPDLKDTNNEIILDETLNKLKKADPRDKKDEKIFLTSLTILLNTLTKISKKEDNTSVRDKMICLTTALKYHDVLSHDPALLIKAIKGLSDDKMTILMSILERNKLNVKFKNSNVNADKLFKR